MKDTKRTFAMVKWGKGILAGLLLATALQLPASADSLPDTRVRVAMYLDMGTTYRSTIPAVTLKADSAWKVSPQNVWDAWANLAAGESVRFSVDGYKIKALQSSDWNVVSAAAKKLQNTTDRPVVFALDQPAGTVYQIFTGPYASVDEANKAASRVESSISSQLGGQKPVAKGSNYYSVGTFGSQGEAESLRQSLTSQGIDAVAVLTGPQQYAVWTGGATSEAELTLTKGQLDQVGGNLQITVVNNTDPA